MLYSLVEIDFERKFVLFFGDRDLDRDRHCYSRADNGICVLHDVEVQANGVNLTLTGLNAHCDELMERIELASGFTCRYVYEEERPAVHDCIANVEEHLWQESA